MFSGVLVGYVLPASLLRARERPHLSMGFSERFYIKRVVLYAYVLENERNLTEIIEKGLRKIGITVSKPILSILFIIFGILVIVLPWLLWLMVGVFFIIEGVLVLTEHFEPQREQQRSSFPSS